MTDHPVSMCRVPEYIVEMLTDEDEEVRQVAEGTLGGMSKEVWGRPEVYEVLQEQLGDDDPRVRRQAAELIAKVGVGMDAHAARDMCR